MQKMQRSCVYKFQEQVKYIERCDNIDILIQVMDRRSLENKKA